ncbi:NAD(P)/FAD-dependent oxidoreductase [Chthonobacter albigriseus]|uniref:NAD(P)/FAD-dependent oxidoreductase n=1 Tax=Chthonobacter albigriseus TaxID=1683161 RepID=UPI0015EFC0CE|nr:FAD-dependent oxidoreductase [Chthonobacter albigriseus]
MRTLIVGAGLVGVAAAHALLDEGHEVEIVDREGFAAGASFGNAGWIAHADILPLASPKAWANLPRWLADPLGPLTIRPSYLPKLMPWLIRFALASRPAEIETGIAGIAALNTRALPAWERRLDGLVLSHHLRRRGILHIWRDAGLFAAAGKVFDRQSGFGIRLDRLDAAGVREVEPALANGIAGGVLYGDGCHVSDPARLTQDLGVAALGRGARLTVGAARAIEPTSNGATLVLTDGRRLSADRIVVAAGAWSRALAATVGDRVPLDTERGYNVTLAPGTLGLSRPVAYEGEGFVTTPLDSGDRVGGAVEFAGLEAAPNYARVDAMLGRLKRVLPEVDTNGGTRWMGFRPSIPDSLPVIGPSRASPHVVHAFGHGHYGLTQAAVTADIVAALVAGRTPPVDPAPYSPRRF